MEYNKPERLGFLDNISNSNIVKLWEIIFDQSYWILPPSNVYNDENNSITYLRATELKPDLEIDFVNCLKVPEKFYSNNRAILKKNDVLIAVKWATIASNKCVWFIENEIWKAILNGSIFRFQVKENINPKFIAYILNSDFWRKQMKLSLVANNAVDYLNKETIENFKIPLPPLEIQNQIVEKMDLALKEKKEKEMQAKTLLESIDDFVLSELWIEYKEVEEKKVFGLSLSELGETKRLDPFFNNPSFNNFRNLQSNFDVFKLEDLITETKTWLPIRSDNRIENWLYPYYWANWIIWYMNDFTHDGNYIVAWQDWYIWNHYVVQWKFWASNHNWVMWFKNGINFDYIKAVLDISNYDYLITGWVIPKLTREALLSIKIPLPPLEIQEKIALEVKSRIEKAKILEIEAKEVYEKAKREVEGMILD